MPTWFWSLLALALFFPVLIRVLSWFSARGLRLQPGSHRIAHEGEVPEWEREVLRGADELMSAQGFQFRAYGWQKESVAGAPDSRYVAYFEHESLPAFAAVKLAHFPVPQCPFLIHYLSRFADGRMLCTRNMDPHSDDPYLPWMVVQDRFSASWDEVWAAHREGLAGLEATVQAEKGTVEALIRLRDKADRDSWQAQVERRILVPVPDAEGVMRLGLKESWSVTRRLVQWAGPMTKNGLAWMKQAKAYPLSPRAEAESWLRLQRVKMDAGGWGKAALVVASLGAMALLWGNNFSWGLGLAFLLVLTVHELGHALMMRWVGYRDVNIFFIPFFGAMATGRPDKVLHPWQEALVLLAGPVPGLLAGAWLMVKGSDHSAFFTQLGSLSLAINGINLLPITPLDGGKLMDLILFRRTPRLGQAFLVLSAVALGAGAAYLKEPILGAVAVAVFLNAGKSYRQARILADWRRQRDRDQENKGDAAQAALVVEVPSVLESVEELFRRLRDEKPIPFRNKVVQVKAMLGALHTRAPRWGTVSGLLAVYACAWISPLALMAWPHLGKPYVASGLTREDLRPGERHLWDRLCADSSVADIDGHQSGDTLYLILKVHSQGDTLRLRWLTKELNPGKVNFWFRAPIWPVGGLDSTLGRDIVNPWLADSKDELLSKDSATALEDRYFEQVDSVREIEEGIWRSLDAGRRRAVLEEAKRKAEGRGDSLRCWKL